MTRWRRVLEPGGTFFFTLVTDGRRPILTTPEGRALLRGALRECRRRWPFAVEAMVLLPDHLHTIWRLPEGDSAYPLRWAWIKKEFSKGWLATGGEERPRSASRRRQGRRGVMQRRYWEHRVRDEGDFARLADYIHYNPVKHGHAACPGDWAWSSFHRFVRAGMYPADWGCAGAPPVADMDSVGEWGPLCGPDPAPHRARTRSP